MRVWLVVGYDSYDHTESVSAIFDSEQAAELHAEILNAVADQWTDFNVKEWTVRNV